MNRRDWLLLTVAAARGAPLSPVHLQKSLFLIGENLSPGAGFYAFVPYDYGPFCAAIYDDARALEAQGLIVIEPDAVRSYRQYRALPAGITRASDLRERLPDEAREYVGTVVDWMRDLSFNQLISAIYRAYPQMQVNSVFRN